MSLCSFTFAHIYHWACFSWTRFLVKNKDYFSVLVINPQLIILLFINYYRQDVFKRFFKSRMLFLKINWYIQWTVLTSSSTAYCENIFKTTALNFLLETF